MANKETKQEYHQRITTNTVLWLCGREANCHPLVWKNIDDLFKLINKLGYKANSASQFNIKYCKSKRSEGLKEKDWNQLIAVIGDFVDDLLIEKAQGTK